MSGRLHGKRAIVTGAGSGIGRATTRSFVAEGASVLAVDLDESGLAKTESEIQEARIRKAGGGLRTVVCDVSDEVHVAELVERCVREFGGLEVFYANAGIGGEFAPLLELSAQSFERVLQVNLIGPFLAIKHGALHMREHGGGSILATASVAGLRSGAGPTPYSASKAGVISLVQTAAYQLSGTGIRVNAICPGLIETGMTKPIFDMARSAGKEHKIGQLNPLRRYGAPDEIASMALFLASDESSYVNGQAFAVDGGLSSSHPYVPGNLA